ncbi:MAG: T9SS type A sorting domain-containing protein [Chitinophagales bacterium]
MAISFLSTHKDAEAQVFYTDVEPDYIFTETETPPQSGALSVDFNHDGTPELAFAFSSFEFTGDCYRAGSMSFYIANYASLMVYNDTFSITRVQIVNEGEEIGPGAIWDNNVLHTLMFSDFFSDTCIPDPGTPFISGNWTDVSNKYIGVKFNDGAGNTHYGWIRLSVVINSEPGDAYLQIIEVDRYAFESQIDVPITAGVEGEPMSIAQANTTAFTISPNPATDMLHIAMYEPINAPYILSVYSMQMSEVIPKREIVNTNAQLHVKDLPNGMYLLVIEWKGHKHLQKFIKQ